MEIKYRYSKKEDCNDILSLLLMCFVSKITSEVIENIENRYLLAYCDNKLVAITGLSDDTYFDGAEIDWTCCHPDYRCRGIISDMLGIVLKSAKNDVYCKCLRTYQKEYANLHSIMIKYGFTCVKRNYKEFHISNDIICEICPYKNDNIACVCYEDLYVMRLKGK